MSLQEDALRILVTTFPSGTRDFRLVRAAGEGAFEAIHPLELLSLYRTAKKIESLGQSNGPLAVALALCRLLVPCLKYRGSDRHLVIEPWTEEDLRGESIAADVRTTFAKDLSAEQAETYRAVTAGESPPTGSLAELFWDTQTNLPDVPAAFEDPDLGRLCKALFFQLVPEGESLIEVDVSAVTAQLESLRAKNFDALNVGIPARQMPALFRKLLAVTVRYASQITGSVVEEMIIQQLREAGRPVLTLTEKEMLAVRYGASRALGDINVGFLFGCGPLLGDLINDFFFAISRTNSPQVRANAQEQLRSAIFLLRSFQQYRKQARAQERREDRQLRADAMPLGPRHQAEFQADTSVAAPDEIAATNEELARLKELLPLLKDRNAKRLQAYIDCQGDRKAAAEKLGLNARAFSQQLRQTVFPAMRKLARKEGWDIPEKGEQ